MNPAKIPARITQDSERAGAQIDAWNGSPRCGNATGFVERQALEKRTLVEIAPTIETSRLRLRPPAPDCEQAYHRFYTNAEASADYGGPLSASAAAARLASDARAWHLQGFGVWAVQIQSSAEFVGVCGFWQGKDWPRELTWWLLPSGRGKGIALEASRAVVNHAYSDFGWDEVQTYMNDSNAPARALVLRLGGEIVARRTFPDRIERNVYRIPQQSGG